MTIKLNLIVIKEWDGKLNRIIKVLNLEVLNIIRDAFSFPRKEAVHILKKNPITPLE